MNFSSYSIKNKFAWAILIFLLSVLAQANPIFTTTFPTLTYSPAQNNKRIELIHADHWFYDEYEHPDAQRLSGNVVFRHDGMILKCDSAVYFQAGNSFEAYDNVRLTQGDTLSLTGKRMFYDGNEALAEARENVILTHRGQILTTDSLNYDRLYGKAYFFDGGKLVDKDNTLTLDWGEYYTDTRQSTFNYNVELINPKFRLVSDTLHYNTITKIAEIVGPSNIYSDKNQVATTHGFYYTQTGQIELFDRSTVLNGENTMIGDSIYYNEKNGIMEAFRNVVYHDKTNKNILSGDYCKYNDIIGEAIAYGNALAKYYANKQDTLFVHADTLRLFSYNLKTDSTFRVLHGYFHARAYRSDVQAVSDSLVFNSLEHKLSLYRDPIVWSENKQIVGEEINIFANDSTIDSIYVPRPAIQIEQLDSVHFNQVTAHLLRSYFKQGEMKLNCADGNVHIVNFPLEKDSTIIYQNYTETSQLRMFMENRKLRKLWAPASTGCFYVAGLAPAERTRLSNFAWFDYIRPRNKYDLFEWRPKKKGMELKPSIRHEAPIQKFE